MDSPFLRDRQIFVCLWISYSGHRPCENLHIALLLILSAFRGLIVEHNNRIFRGKSPTHQISAIKLLIHSQFYDGFDCGIQLF